MANVLVVDDDVEFLDSVAAVLKGKGHQVATAPNGAEALAKAKQAKPDVMLLDVMMATDREGFDVVRRLREDAETRTLPIVMVTGIRKAKGLPFGFEPDEDWLPVKAVLEKPVDPQLLLQSVEDAIE